MLHCELEPLILIVYAAYPVDCGCRRVQCDQIAGGLLLWLFGYIMFNNTHGNSVDRILLPYAREIADGDEDVPPYS